MIEFHSSSGLVLTVDEIDADLTVFKWSTGARPDGATLYAVRGIQVDGNPKTLYLHRVIVSRLLDRELAQGECVDHIDSNPLNNRRSNLRLASLRDNGGNQRLSRRNKTGYKGVSYTPSYFSKPFQAHCAGKNLGLFDTAEEAHAAYCVAALAQWGEFANFGSSPSFTPSAQWSGGTTSTPAAALIPAPAMDGVARSEHHSTTPSPLVPIGVTNGA